MEGIKLKFIAPMQEKAKQLSDLIKETNGLWDEVYEEYNKNAVELVKEGYAARISFYHFMREISHDCEEHVNFFDGVIEYFNVAKANKKFDIVHTTELKRRITKVSETQKKIQLSGEETAGKIRESKRNIDDEKFKMQFDLHNRTSRYPQIGYALGVGANTGGTFATMLATGATMTLAGSIAVAAVCGAVGFGIIYVGVTEFLDYCKKKKLKKLARLSQLLEKLLDKMRELERETVEFQNTNNAMALEINKYMIAIEKCIKYSSGNTNLNAERVVVMADDMLAATDELKKRFKDFGDEAKSKEISLQKLIQNDMDETLHNTPK
ncbi:uncharacterized protein EV154DRAFT_575855 [Mucor mucedo]|uniref:uncharacterized protein n=1 Tax=Mucor mucedo TaxID=29922 RepID=UPI00221F687A|nr:uncharacterized protein EV154DRAFT_575855 [Mucor mucedo]KAI7879850.1 hypothetical protein EV154DRAFT_575855 [Mucor mucedo]